MTVFTSDKALAWGALDLPMFGLARDMENRPVDPPAGFCLARDDRRLWFVAHHRAAAQIHPEARPGAFQTELWRWDVAEWFVAHPDSGRYLEFNLAPNGAWWSCEFTAPRMRADATDIAFPEVATFADLAPDGAWVAAMAIPIDLLEARIGFGPGSTANVAMILGSPAQRFLSAAPLGGGPPDFHRPERFAELSFVPLPPPA